MLSRQRKGTVVSRRGCVAGGQRQTRCRGRSWPTRANLISVPPPVSKAGGQIISRTCLALIKVIIASTTRFSEISPEEAVVCEETLHSDHLVTCTCICTCIYWYGTRERPPQEPRWSTARKAQGGVPRFVALPPLWTSRRPRAGAAALASSMPCREAPCSRPCCLSRSHVCSSYFSPSVFLCHDRLGAPRRHHHLRAARRHDRLRVPLAATAVKLSKTLFQHLTTPTCLTVGVPPEAPSRQSASC